MSKVSVRNLSLGATALILLGWGAFRLSEKPRAPQLQGTVLPPGKTIPEFELIDAAGRVFTAADLRNKWTVMSFGFTHCPDICPTTLAYFRDELKALPEGAPVQFLFVGIDPERDPPAQLATFVQSFHPAIQSVTGSVPALQSFASSFAAYFKKEGQGDKDLYSMAHSPQYFLINPEGQWQVLYTPPMTRGALSGDLINLAKTRS